MIEPEGKKQYTYERPSFLIWVHDVEGRIIQANDEVVKVSGYSKPELLRLNINDLVSGDSPDWFKEIIELVFNNGSPKKEVVFKKKNGLSTARYRTLKIF